MAGTGGCPKVEIPRLASRPVPSVKPSMAPQVQAQLREASRTPRHQARSEASAAAAAAAAAEAAAAAARVAAAAGNFEARELGAGSNRPRLLTEEEAQALWQRGAFIPPAVRNKRQSRQAPWQRDRSAEDTGERARDRTPPRVSRRPSQQHTPQHRIRQPSHGCGYARLQEHHLQQPTCRTPQLDRFTAGCPCYTSQLWQQGCACQGCQHPRCSFQEAPCKSGGPHEEQEFAPHMLAPSPQGRCDPPKRVRRTPAVAHPTAKPWSQMPSYAEGLPKESQFCSAWDEWRDGEAKSPTGSSAPVTGDVREQAHETTGHIRTPRLSSQQLHSDLGKEAVPLLRRRLASPRDDAWHCLEYPRTAFVPQPLPDLPDGAGAGGRTWLALEQIIDSELFHLQNWLLDATGAGPTTCLRTAVSCLRGILLNVRKVGSEAAQQPLFWLPSSALKEELEELSEEAVLEERCRSLQGELDGGEAQLRLFSQAEEHLASWIGPGPSLAKKAPLEAALQLRSEVRDARHRADVVRSLLAGRSGKDKELKGLID
ncbi:PHS1 [Symbiodinium sp. CCMP2456]|nr:PHS1 [Symbiodinium sp. CCMP2456]